MAFAIGYFCKGGKPTAGIDEIQIACGLFARTTAEPAFEISARSLWPLLAT
jgi:hypothetical protein